MNLIRLCPLWLATYATEGPTGESSKTLRATNEAEARKRLKLRLGKIPANLKLERFNAKADRS